ncbi:MAG: putative drug exporter of the superfamily [Actinomycetota bacterium]|nr:putative drug exporter of the superfamily [Actinomycetota bacterium]
MATLLYRLGRFSFRHPWRFVAVWLILMIGILGGGLALGGKTSDSFAIPGTESQNAIDRLAAVFPSAAGASAQIVVQVPDGDSVAKQPYESAIEKLVTAAGKVPGVDSASSPFGKYASNAVSADKTAAIIAVQFTGQQEDVKPSTLTDLQKLSPIATDAGMKVGFGGNVFQSNTVSVSPTEGLGVIFAGVVLFIAFGSLLAAGMPLLTALLGIGVTMGGVIAASAFTTIGSSTPLLALMIGLAVGIDYGLFILSRHRNQLANGQANATDPGGMSPEESAATAVATAGSAVVFAGGTVIIALLGLLVVGIPFLSAMGVAAAAGVLVAILASITLLPALLGIAGRRLVPKPGSRAHRRAVASEAPSVGLGGRSFGERWVKLVMKAPVIAVVAVIGILGTLAIPAFSLQLALPDGASQPVGSTTRTSYDMIAQSFGPGRNGPLIVLVDITQTNDIVGDLSAIRTELQTLGDVDYVSQGLPNQSFDTAILQVIPKSAPDSPKTTALVNSIRDLSPSIDKKYDTPIQVTGATAVQIDISSRLNGALVPFGLIVVGLSILLLMMVFRSVFIPIKAAVGFLLSVLSSFGVVVAIFQFGWFSDALGVIPGPILSFLPILLMAVLFGLAMDYEVFLVSGMRETFVHTGDAKKAIVTGFSGAARVVTAAALIMFFVFGSFVPEGTGVIKAIALGLAVGILADAFLVRMTLVPAAMALVGRAAWWMPKWLSRILPNVDIEGERLREHREALSWAATECADDVITTEQLVAGGVGSTVGPLSVRVAAGSLVLVSGASSDRKIVAATLAGRLDPVSGRAQVGGYPLPSDSAKVARLVALEDVGGSDRAEVRASVGELLIERLRLTQPWYRVTRSGRRARIWTEKVNSVLGSTISRNSTMESLSHLQRAVTLAAIALSERTPVVMLDLLDAFGSAEDEVAFIRAIDRLAPQSTTVVVGRPMSPQSVGASDIRRTLTIVDLPVVKQSLLERTLLERKGAHS